MFVGKDSCQGDSGGPFITEDTKVNAKKIKYLKIFKQFDFFLLLITLSFNWKK